MLVVGLNGSPRHPGNTEILLNEALKGTGKDAKTVRFDIAFMDVAPCQACEDCFKDGECVLTDEMDKLYDLLEMADVIIVASPIYFSGMSAQTKCMVDRCQALWVRRHLLKLNRRPGVGGIILAAAQPQAKFDNALSELRAFLIGIGVRPTGSITVGGLERRGAVSERPEALSQAFSLGQELVRSFNSPGP